jgi:anti-sigma B factor antagonist
MVYRIEDNAGFAVIHLEGEVDLSRSPAARQAILDCLQARRNVLVDLNAVTYIDSSGVASLVEGFQVSRHLSLDFALVGVSDAALSVLRLARLDQVFPIFTSLESRLAQAAPKA